MKSKYSILLLLSLSLSLKAQTNNPGLPKVIPMSPNAGSLAQYIDYPVSYYTGTPNINIPIYEIDVDGYKLPISLSYHASGIKVSQEASWVGLGWALNAGGAISRTIKGFDDFNEFPYPGMDLRKGYYNDPDITNPYSQYYFSMAPDEDNYNGEALGYINVLTIDTEPDIFYYSLPGASGKFLIDKSRGPVLLDKSSNVKIELVQDNSVGSYFPANLCFRIITPDGTQYYYKGRETTKVYSANRGLNNNSISPTRKLDDTPGTYPNGPIEYTSSWYLDKITTSNKREIIFEYLPETFSSPTQESCKYYNMLDSYGSQTCGPRLWNIYYQCSKTTQENLRLSKISWEGGYVDFLSSEREDMIGINNYTKPKKLDFIKIYRKDDALIKQFNFNYSYFNSNETGQYQYVYKRLKLNSVLDSGDPNNKHSFEYFGGDMLAKNSNNIDYWGYNNGKIYGNAYYIANFSGGVFYPGANKGSDFEFLKIGTLNKIILPTGGTTIFNYEPNSFPSNIFTSNIPETTETKFLQVYNQYSTIGEWEDLPATDSYTFTIQGTAKISIKKTIENLVAPQTDPNFLYDNSSFLIGRLKRISPTEQIIRTFKMPLVNERSDYGGYTDVGESYFPEILSAGTYVFEALLPPRDVYTGWKIKLLVQNPPSQTPVLGAGLRVSKIITGDKIRNFTYPTGKLMVKPTLAYMQSYHCDYGQSFYGMNTLIQLSNPTIPLSTLRNGNEVGYDWVEEKIANGLKTRYTYFNTPEETLYDEEFSDGYFPFAPSDINYSNGLIDKIDYYAAEPDYSGNGIAKTIKYTYNSEFSPPVKAFVYNSGPNLIYQYNYKIEWLKKTVEETTNQFSYYPNYDRNTITGTHIYDYNTYAQIISDKTLNENNTWDKKITRYATDFSDPVSQQMVLDYSISTPIEILNLRNDLVLSGQKTEYQKLNGIYVPKTIYSLKTTSPLSPSSYQSNYSPDIQFESYNQWGKILQIKVHHKNFSYLWCNNGQYPIAEIENATYSEIVSALGQAAIDQLNETSPSDTYIAQKINSLRNALPNARISDYRYKPLIGMSQKTDLRGISQTFEYNTNHQLQFIKDYNGDIIKKFTYHYQGE